MSGLSHIRAELQRLAPGLRVSAGPGRDFGGPLAGDAVCVETRELEDVQHVLQVARRLDVPVSCRGSGHTSAGQTAAPDGIVLRHHGTGSVALDGDRARAPAGLSWGSLEEQLAAHELELPVATSAMQPTLAGTLSLAGIGVRSIKRGAQVDHVEALQLIGCDGTLHHCSPAQNAELFYAALTGLGQVGVLHQVELRCASRAERVAQRTWTVAGYARLAEQLSWFESAPEALLPDLFCAIGRGENLDVMVANAGSTTPRDAPAPEPFQLRVGESSSCQRSLADFQREERAMPPHWQHCRHVWADYCLNAEGFRRFGQFVDEELSGRLRGHLGYVLALSNPELPYALDPRPRGSRRVFSVGLFFSVAAGDAPALAQARADHAAALEVCMSLGGRPYLHGVWGGRAGLDRRALRAAFSASAESMLSLRQRLDPRQLLNRNALNLLE